MKRVIKYIKKKWNATKRQHPIIEWHGSAKYWEERYASGGNSGIGSYGKLAEFKAEILNTFIRDNSIKTVIEWGCGDGNQLRLAEYPSYIGFDVSLKSIQICSELFRNDHTKSFIYCGEDNFSTDKQADLSISLDVIYHLVEDSIYNTYMHRLFTSSKKYVCIYSCNDEDDNNANHVKHRRFTDWIEKNLSGWKLIIHIPNKYPYDPMEAESSWSDFYFYEKTSQN